MKILVTGGAGFIGSNFIRYVLAHHPQDDVVNLDALTYAGNLENLSGVAEHPRYRFVRGDIANRVVVDAAMRGVAVVVNCAAETHVDRSIDDAATFLHTNVSGTVVLLDAARQHGVQRFLQVSTDEVYGSLGPTGQFTESSPLCPSSPYSASKASADLLALSFWTTYQLPVMITRCSNNFGPYQFPEKVLPLFVTNAIEDQPLPLYGDGLNVREWIHVEDHCAALDEVMRHGRSGDVYNIGGGNELTNRALSERILQGLGKPLTLIQYVTDRPGHDRRYAIDAGKIQRELGWRPVWGFEDGLRHTIAWYRDNSDWWHRVKSGEYRSYYERLYGARLRAAGERTGAT